MHRTRPALIVAVVAALALAGSACGVLADTTAATVAGRTVSIDSVEQLQQDEGFVELVLGLPAVDESQGRVPGNQFRTILGFQVEREALLAEVERWGATMDLASARAELDEQLAAEGSDWAETSRTVFAEYRAAQTALQQRFAQLDPTNDSDLRRVYDESPSLWDRLCVAVTQIGPEQSAEAEAALAAGATVEDLPERVEGAVLVVEPSQCISTDQLSGDLATAFEDATPGEDTGPVAVDDGQGGQATYVFRIEARRTIGFDEAREELAGIVGSLAQGGPQSWISFIVANAEIDPRFGQGVTVGQQGALIEPPPVPLADGPALTDPFAPAGSAPQ